MDDFIRRYCNRIARLCGKPLTIEQVKVEELLLHRDQQIEVYYAPFDHINSDAQLAIVGVTPGPTQLLQSYRVICEHVANRRPLEQALAAVKAEASFRGMRKDLVRWLDEVGVAGHLGVRSCGSLFHGSDRHLLHTTSAVRYPTFVRKPDGGHANYNGGFPPLVQHPHLRRMIEEVLAPELERLGSALIVPLGKANEGIKYLCSRGALDESRCLIGMPHPSPASARREILFQRARRSLQAQLAGSEGSQRRPRREVQPRARAADARSSAPRRPRERPRAKGTGRDAIEITLTQGNLNNDHVYLRDHLDFFPRDAIGGTTRAEQGRMLTIRFDGLAEPVETDIAGGNKLFFRARTPWRRFFEKHSLQAGDRVRIQRLDAYEYRVLPAR